MCRLIELLTFTSALSSKMVFGIILYLLLLIHQISGQDYETDKYRSGNNTDVDAALRFLDRYNRMMTGIKHASIIAEWNHGNNLTDHNQKLMFEQEKLTANITKKMWKEAITFAWKELKDKNESAYRSFKHISKLGNPALPEEKHHQLDELIANMSTIYGKTKICPYNNTQNLPCNMTIEPDLTEAIKKPGNYEELKYYWVQWRDNTGKKFKHDYLKLVKLLNEAAKLNGFSDAGDYRRENYESETFKEDVDDLWETLKPFYQQLHAYVRRKLMNVYEGYIKPDGPIPANVLANMWSQGWTNIFDLVNPYPTKARVDATESMLKKNLTALQLFTIAEDFFTSLGLIPMPETFWKNSVIEKPQDREIICHASAWDTFFKNDVRIKMCARIDEEHLITIHHEMGHAEYFLQYNKQPMIFKDGANPGFHEAVGDTLALSVSTPHHLYKIGLLEKPEEDHEIDINFLLSMALQKIGFLPFGYLIDAYRWQIFDGTITPENMNSKWWDFRLKYQGICPPVLRTEEDFDAGSKYHVVADVPYIRYFVSYVIQFQFHKALCNASGYTGPLHKCDIYGSKEAGKLLSEMLSLGSSVHWEDAMKVITQGETTKMDAGPLLEYFSPLLVWLEKQNENETIGWKSDNPMVCP